MFLNAVFWNLRTGAPWRDLPPDYGDWKNTPNYSLPLLSLAGPSVWEELLNTVIDDPDFEWLMIDATHIKVHPDAGLHVPCGSVEANFLASSLCLAP